MKFRTHNGCWKSISALLSCVCILSQREKVNAFNPAPLRGISSYSNSASGWSTQQYKTTSILPSFLKHSLIDMDVDDGSIYPSLDEPNGVPGSLILSEDDEEEAEARRDASFMSEAIAVAQEA